MVTNLNETFAAVQAASRLFWQKMKKTSHEWIRMIQSMTG